MTAEKKHTNMLRYVEYRLEEWAHWYSRGCYMGLGYPNQSTIAALKEYQGVMIKTQGIKPIATNEQAEEIEDLMKELALQNKRLTDVLRQNYFGVGTAAYKAEQVGLSYAHFKVQLDMAKQWLAGRLTGR